MSQSPIRAVDPSEAPDYVAASDRLNRLIRQGRPFSGGERNCAFLNTGAPRFANISSAAGIDTPDDGRAVAVTDWDQDGDLDLWMMNRTAPLIRYLQNDVGSGSDWLAVRLSGKGRNRDAIGSRVELHVTGEGAPAAPLLRTVRAGDGFLSQSTKWLHFGLGGGMRIERLVVRWPDGERETFTGLEPRRRYRIVRGRGKAEPLPPRPGPVRLEPSDLPTAPTGILTRVPLHGLAPLPRLDFETMSGEEAALEPGEGPVRLLNLWASWCQPCVKELGELTDNAGRLREAGVEILALSVDGLDAERGDTKDGARQLLDKIGFPFRAGWATVDLLDTLDRFQLAVFGRQRALPVPTSLLIDPRGLVAAIYKGAIPIDRLVNDVAAVRADGVLFRAAALPEPGRWDRPPETGLSGSVALELIEAGRLDQAGDYLRRIGDLTSAVPELSADPYYRTALLELGNRRLKEGRATAAEVHYREALRVGGPDAATYYNLGQAMGKQGRHRDAMSLLRQAVALDPAYADARNDLGSALANLGRLDEAVAEFREAVRLNPSNSRALTNLGNALQELARPAEAADAFRRAVLLRAEDSALQHLLGSALLQTGEDEEEAERHLRESIRLDPSGSPAHFTLALVLHVRGEPTEAAAHYREALKIAPQSVAANNLAWILATHPDARQRDGSEAVRLATAVCESTGYRQAVPLDTLAAALAELGRFEEAVETATRAADRARAAGRTEYGTRIEARLDGYRDGRPFRTESLPS